jgi:hypothetical protein
MVCLKNFRQGLMVMYNLVQHLLENHARDHFIEETL